MKLDIQLFGGRGASSSKRTKTNKASGGLTDSEKEAIFDYTTSRYQSINESLRSGGSGNTKEDKEIVKELDKAINKSELKNGATLYRGSSVESVGLEKHVRNLTTQDVKSLVGKEITNKAYTSTTTSKQVSERFSGRSEKYDGTVNWVITAKGRKKGLDVGKNSNFGDKEKEVILPRNAKLKITKATKRAGTLTVYAEY